MTFTGVKTVEHLVAQMLLSILIKKPVIPLIEESGAPSGHSTCLRSGCDGHTPLWLGNPLLGA